MRHMKNRSALILAMLSCAPLGVAQTAYTADVLALNPLGYWRLDGNANDATVRGNHGVTVNGVAFTSPGGGAPIGDLNGQAASFNNILGPYIRIPAGEPAAGTLFDIDGFQPITMMAWVKTTATSNSMIVLAKEENTGNFRGQDLFIDNGNDGAVPGGSGRFGMRIVSTPGNGLRVESGVSVNDGNWHFLAGAYDGSGQAGGIRLYLDGVPVATFTVQNGLSGGSTLNNVPVTIGSRDSGGSAYNGLLDEAAIFGTALSAAQVLQLANDILTVQKILPQLAFGGGWYTALYFTNTSASALSFPVNFIGDNGSPLTLPSVGGTSMTVRLAARGTAIIEAPDIGALVQGYVATTLPGGVTGYAIFRQTVEGRPDQEAVVPLSGATSTTSTLIWDDSNFTTTVGIVNPSPVATSVAITVRDAQGVIIGNSVVPLAARNKTAAILRNFPGLAGMAGNRGSADFTVAFGNVAVLGLRFGGSAFTSIPTTDR
jgi:hypothetical protein